MARRTVSVYLELLAAQFHREGRQIVATATSAGASVDELGDQADGAARDMLGLATTTEVAKRQVDDLGDTARHSAADLALLQGRLDATAARIRNLGAAYAATGDESFLADVRKERRLLAQIDKLRGDMGGRKGGGLGGLLGGIPNIGGVPGPLVAGGAAATAALAPFLGGVIASAVLGGVGTGGLIGGIALASKDTRVRGAWAEFGRTMFTEIGDASSPFVAPLVGVAHRFAAEWHTQLPTVREDFKLLSQAVDPVADGLLGFVRNIHPGLTSAWRAGLPLARQFGTELERTGAGTSDFLESMADSAPGAKIALHDLFTVLIEGERQLGQGIEILSATYEWTRKLGLVAPPEWLMQASKGALPAWLDVIGQARESYALLTGGVETSTRTFTSAAAATEALKREQAEQLKVTEEQRRAMEANTKAVADYFDTIMGQLDAPERWEQALDDLTLSVKENGRTLDIHTAQGRANRNALEEAVQATKDMYDAGLLTDAAYRAQIRSLEAWAVKLGLGKDAVHDLLGAFEQLPGQVITTLTLKLGGAWAAILKLGTLGSTPPSISQQGRGGSDLTGPTGGTRPLSSQTFIEGLTPRAGGGPLVPGVPYLFEGRQPEVGVFGQPGVVYPSMSAFVGASAIDYQQLAAAMAQVQLRGTVMMDGQVVGDLVDVRVETAQRSAGDYATNGAR